MRRARIQASWEVVEFKKASTNSPLVLPKNKRLWKSALDKYNCKSPYRWVWLEGGNMTANYYYQIWNLFSVNYPLSYGILYTDSYYSELIIVFFLYTPSGSLLPADIFYPCGSTKQFWLIPNQPHNMVKIGLEIEIRLEILYGISID